MLENLLQLIKEQGQTDVVENPDVPNEQNTAVLEEASHAVAGTMQNAVANGQTDQLQHLFQTGGDASQVMSNPLAQNMQGSFIDNITSKLGIGKGVASGIAASLIPMVLSKLVNRTNSNAPQDSGFSLPGLISSLTGGGGGIGSVIGQMTGGNNNNGSGGFSLPNIISQVTGGGQQQPQQSSGGGLGDIIKGFFGK